MAAELAEIEMRPRGLILPAIAEKRLLDAYAEIERTLELVQCMRELTSILDPCGCRRRYQVARDVAALLKRLPRARRPVTDPALSLAGQLEQLGLPSCPRRIVDWMD